MDSGIRYSERELIQRAIKQARPLTGRTARWVMVKRVFGTGRTVSRVLCEKYGFDPDKTVRPFAALSDSDYEENLIQHGVIR